MHSGWEERRRAWSFPIVSAAPALDGQMVGTMKHVILAASMVLLTIAAHAFATNESGPDSHFGAAVISFDPAPGQWVNNPVYFDATRALGSPFGDDPSQPNNGSLVSLGGFGGSITLAFDHTVLDDPANPFGLDAIVYGNALWSSGNPNRHWAECGVIEISHDVNDNDLADDPWYLIPGTHVAPSPSQYEVHTWDDNLSDNTWPPFSPPATVDWIPPGNSGTWTTQGYHLPAAIFDQSIVVNPLGSDATEEGIWGYADFAPTMALPVGDDVEIFYTRPDNPFAVGITDGAAGGDAFDIAWAVDPNTWLPANLAGFDFIRIRTAVDLVLVNPPLGELSTEIDAVADVAEGTFGDTENDGDIDGDDWLLAEDCFSGVGGTIPPAPCRVLDFDQDGDLDLADVIDFQASFTGEGP